MAITICLNMIVKNESKIILRLLESVYRIIDTYVVCDTGSTDNTLDIMTDFLTSKGIKGETFREPFKNFGYNRTIALERARGKATYALLMDADMKLVIREGFDKQKLENDCYYVLQTTGDLEYYNLRFVTLSKSVECVGPTHEYYQISNMSIERLNSVFIEDLGDGGSKHDKFCRDIRLLKEGLEKEPENPRYYFYLANSYFNSGKFNDCIPFYIKHIEINGWNEEVFQSYLNLGCAYKNTNKQEMAISTWLNGYNHRPTRAETVYELCKLYREIGKHQLSFSFYNIGKSIPYPKDDILFVKAEVYTYLFDYELSIIGYYIKLPIMHCVVSRIMNKVRDNLYNNVLNNYKFYTRILNNETKVKRICLDNSFRLENVCGTEYKIYPSNICIFRFGNEYAVNIRYVNYFINRSDGSYNFNGNVSKILTINKFLKLDKDLNAIHDSQVYIIPENDRLQYVGIEDVKVFNEKFLGTALDSVTNNLSIICGKYTPDTGKICGNIIKPNLQCEKNWCFFGDENIVYKWFPLQIGKISTQNCLEIIHTDNNTPLFYRRARGSTNGVKVDNEFWFICHIVEYSSPRKYYHFFSVIDEEFKIKRWSELFKFEGSDIEYCLGLIIEDDNILVSYSLWDSNPTVAVYCKKDVEKTLYWSHIN